MKVMDIATHHVVTVSPTATIVEAARLMREHHVGTVVLVETTRSIRAPIGLVTDRDIVVGAIAQGVDNLADIKVADIAAHDLVVADADREISEVSRLMLASGVRRIPIVNSTGALVGIVTYDDVMAWMADEIADFGRLFARQRRRERKARS
jgi:CBS domain-containing protein